MRASSMPSVRSCLFSVHSGYTAIVVLSNLHTIILVLQQSKLVCCL
uniref:Uncharacterized protein n=1 Tax=Arundo donax TaxID=35708 RepID=A0A0A9B081_ARUDO